MEQARQLQKAKDQHNKADSSNIVVDGEQYDFCHHCKQLKNTFLLVSCKYSSRASCH